MHMSPISHHPGAAGIPIDRTAAKAPHEAKLEEASRQFEAVLLRQILRDAQKPMLPSTIHAQTATSEIYRDMSSAALAEAISKSRALGLAEALTEQLGRQFKASAEKL
jgi:Rod binding domain-containing protein